MIYSYLLYTKIRILSILLRAHNPPYNNAFISCKHFLVYQSDGYLTLNPLDSKFSKNEKDGAKRTSHKDVRKYPMKSRLRVPNEENPSWTVGL